jgi:hypothetical protein
MNFYLDEKRSLITNFHKEVESVYQQAIEEFHGQEEREILEIRQNAYSSVESGCRELPTYRSLHIIADREDLSSFWRIFEKHRDRYRAENGNEGW